MFFKNIFVFAFTRTFSLTQEEIEAKVSENEFTPCSSTELSHFGWTNPFGKHGNQLTHESCGNLLLCARFENKIIPAQIIKEMLEDRIDVLESEQGRSATKKEKEQFKEDITFELLPRAFPKITDVHGYLNIEHNIIVINTSSRSKAEDFLSLLRKSLGTLPVTCITPETCADEVMTDWLSDHEGVDHCLDNSKFNLGMEAEFNGIGIDSSIAIVKNLDLNCDEVKAHLEAGKYVSKVALEYNESMSFILNDDLSVKRIKFFDIIKEQNDDIDVDDILVKLDADFTLMAGELNRMITDLFSEFYIDTSDYIEK